MEWIIGIAVLFMIGSSILSIRTKNQIGRMLGSSPVEKPKVLEAAPKADHTLVRTWIASTKDGRIDAGWRWRCSCGVWGLASGAYSTLQANGFVKYGLGTEKQAIAGFKDHADLYKEANSDYYKGLYEREQAEFAQYRDKCYCKETNSDLIKWKDI